MMLHLIPLISSLILLFGVSLGRADCIPRYFLNGIGAGASFVCVCNSTNCDTVPGVGDLEVGQGLLIRSTKDSDRFALHSLEFDSNEASSESITYQLIVDSNVRYQSIVGFGGGFTDASGINLASLSPGAQDKLLRSYFGTDGIEYGLGRVPIGGADFSTRPYTYDDSNSSDSNLSGFSLAREDFQYKIPLIKKAKALSSKPIKLFASPWSAPAWMKTNKAIGGFGQLLDQYYSSWSDYFVKFFHAYADQGVEFWGLTTQNEPVVGCLTGYSFNCMRWSAKKMAHFIGSYLGPNLEENGYHHLKVMILDDQRMFLPHWPAVILDDPKASRFVSGIAVHWYFDQFVPPSLLTATHDRFPDRFILGSEASAGWLGITGPKGVVLGSWARLDSYCRSIIDDLNNWVGGWVDWNLALDPKGHPNWASYFTDSPIVTNPNLDEFYRQPTFYALGHFVKYIPEESIRIGFELKETGRWRWWKKMMVTSFLRPDGYKTIVLFNPSHHNEMVKLIDKDRPSSGSYLVIKCPANSIQTLVYHA